MDILSILSLFMYVTSCVGAVGIVKPGLAARVEEGFPCFFRV